jgi:hypothetical protein
MKFFKLLGLSAIPALTLTLFVAPSALANNQITTTTCESVSGLTVGTIPNGITDLRVLLEVDNGIATLAENEGLENIAGWAGPGTKGSDQIGFDGTISEVTAALESLKVRGITTGSATVSTTIFPAGASYLESNGHFYSVISGDFENWDAAKTAAENSTYNGMNGYLATITNQEEVDEVSNLGVGGWLGGSDEAVDGIWEWVTGPETGTVFSFTKWANGEPNNFFAEGENYLEMKANSGVWNDARYIEALEYAIVEYGGQTSPIMTPVTQNLGLDVILGVGEIFDPTACNPIPTDILLEVVSQGNVNQAAEIDLVGTPTVSNPFDLSQADVWATVTSPTDQTFEIPLFWFQDYDGALPVGEGKFRLRFLPKETGDWQIDIHGFVNSLELSNVVEPLTVNFTHVTKPQLEVDGIGFKLGEAPFTPIGYNIAWSRQNSLDDYERWFKKSAANGANWARVWMASWGFGIEWKDTGLGDYSLRMNRAKKLDQVFAKAAKYGIQIDLVFLNHGAFSETTNPEWADNPYNIENGGPLTSPAEFATNETAINFWKQRLRYVVARWGAQTSLGVWEWWNEVDFTPIGANDLQDWIAESELYLDTVDAYNHPTTNSWGSGGSLRDWSKVDFASIHVYNDADPIATLKNLYDSMKEAVPDKPILVAEMGAGASGEDSTLDNKGLHMHNSQWAALFTGFGSTAMYWWWDEYIDPLNLWYKTKSLSVLTSGQNLAEMQPMRFKGPKATISQALVGDRSSLVWIRHKNYSRSAKLKLFTAELIKALQENRKARQIKDPVVAASVITIPVSGSGKYKVRIIDIGSGNMSKPLVKSTSTNKLKIKLPKFTGDISVKVIKQS